MNYIPLLIPFLVAYSKPSNELVINKKVDDEDIFWFPVIAGVATKQEMEQATMEEVQILNEVAKRKLDLMGGGNFDG